ncbi:ABC transporter permease subunit [Mesoplasma tabanidae]|uniref:ABC transporter permease protein n=1 Tax=Mesoplasma tabanidae TaxID=219745 RepID=A0A2K8P7W2_9MOLU|nr:ABC transporter permease subunit [Mesoplasma tabanidae]ATZ21685.1 ABC transporter permease protein [Mesoplasma tabanidae]
MINKAIIKQHFKSNFILWLILIIMPAIFVNLIVPLTINQFEGVEELPPIANLLQLAVFTSIGFEIPLIFVIIASNKIMVGEVQTGRITYVVASPLKRTTIINTKIIFMGLSLFIGFILNLILTIPVISINANKIDITLGAYITSLAGMFLLLFMICGITFLASTYFNKAIWSYVVGAGLPILFFIVSMLSSSVDALDSLKYLTLNSLYNRTNVFEFENGKYILASADKWIGQYLAMLIIGAGLFVASSYVFKSKDLLL